MSSGRTQKNRGVVEPQPKAGVQRFSEAAVEGVEVDQSPRGDPVEGQRTSRPVQVYCHSVRPQGRRREALHLVVVPHGQTSIGAVDTPRDMVPSKHTVFTVAPAADSPVGHRHSHSAPPLHLPVAATGQTSRAQQLPTLKPVSVGWVKLVLLHMRHRSAVGR